MIVPRAQTIILPQSLTLQPRSPLSTINPTLSALTLPLSALTLTTSDLSAPPCQFCNILCAQTLKSHDVAAFKMLIQEE